MYQKAAKGKKVRDGSLMSEGKGLYICMYFIYARGGRLYRERREGGGGGTLCLLALGGSFRRKLSLSNFDEHLSRYTVLVSVQ